MFVLLGFLFPVFSQETEATEMDEILLFHFAQKMQAIKDAEKAANEELYLAGKKKLRRGIILTSIGVGIAAIPFISLIGEDDYYYREYGGNRFSSEDALFWTAGGILASIGVPFIIIGKRQTDKYKSQVALAPNGIKFAMEF